MDLAFSADGRLLGTVVGTNGPVRLWDAKTAEERATLCETNSRDRVMQKLAFSPDGRCLAVGSRNGLITVWNPSRLGARARFELGDCTITALAFAPDSRTLAIGQSSGEIRFLDIETGLSRKPLRAHRRMITNLVFSPDGAWLAWNDENGAAALPRFPVLAPRPRELIALAGSSLTIRFIRSQNRWREFREHHAYLQELPVCEPTRCSRVQTSAASRSSGNRSRSDGAATSLGLSP